MSGAISGLSQRAAELRGEFDRAFAERLQLDTSVKIDLIAIRAGAQAFALRLAEISGLFTDKKITPIPGGGAALLGVASFRGTILPVYDLKALLGGSGPDLPRWLAIAAAAPIALAFDAFEGQLRVAQDAVLPQSGPPNTMAHTREFARMHGCSRPILHLASVLDAIKSSQTAPAPKEE